MKQLLKLARLSIESELENKKLNINEEIKKKYSKKQACFVTLTINNKLRGCIGSLHASQELFKDVIENAKRAAFHDYRFYPLRKNEINKIKIEISVLSIPEKLGIGNKVFDKIKKNMGIILKKQNKNSTFLPQVWEQLPDKYEFLQQLSLKAGLNKDDWKEAEIRYYTVKSIKED